MLKHIAGLVLLLAGAWPLSGLAADASWPTKPIRIITPGDAGGVLDI